MTFKEYGLKWLSLQKFSKHCLKRKRSVLRRYIFPAIGEKEVEQITREECEAIFYNDYLMTNPIQKSYIGLTLHCLIGIFDSLKNEGLINNNPTDYIHNVISLYYEKAIIRDKRTFLLSKESPFSSCAFSYLASGGFSKVTYNLYVWYLKAYVHPLIGDKSIKCISPYAVKDVIRFVHCLKLNDAWIEEITSLLKNIFEYAKEKEFIKYNPLEKINLELEHLPEMELDNKQIKDIRNVFAKYGFRRDQRRKVVKEIFFILKKEPFLESCGITFDKVYEKWFDSQIYNGMNQSRKRDLKKIEPQTLPCFEGVSIKSITTNDLELIIETQRIIGNTQPSITAHILISIFEYAAKQNYITNKIALGLNEKNILDKEKDTMSDDEIKEFLLYCKDLPYGYIPAVTLLFGLRISETLGLTISNIDLDNETLLVNHQLSKDHKLVPTKTNNSIRKLPISKCARYFINQALSYKMKHKSKHKNDLLFVKDNGECISYTTAYECIKDACYHIQRPDISPHGLRHMFLTIEARHGDSLTSIKLSAGHSLGRNTIERYLHKNNESRVEAANKKQIYLERILYGYDTNGNIIKA